MEPAIPAAQLLSPADLNFINGLKDSLQDELSLGHDYGGLLDIVVQHLDHLQDDKTSASTLEAAPIWRPLECTQQGLILSISGPVEHQQFQATASSTEEAEDMVAYVSALDAACNRLREIRDRCLEISRKHQELEEEQASLRQPAAVTVDSHIRLLRQYNKTKDVGQQLIGLIAESRGVSLGALYRDGAYGVGPND